MQTLQISFLHSTAWWNLQKFNAVQQQNTPDHMFDVFSCPRVTVRVKLQKHILLSEIFKDVEHDEEHTLVNFLYI